MQNHSHRRDGALPVTAVPAALALVLVVLTAAGCAGEEEGSGDGDALLSPVATGASPSPRISPFPITPSSIPDGRLRSEIDAIPLPSGVDTRQGVVAVSGGEAGREFVTQTGADAIIAFYRDTLVPDGWVGEGEPAFESTQHPGGTDVFKSVRWSFVKNDVRLMLGARLAPTGPSGETIWALTIQPVWYPGWNQSGIPAPSMDTTPIPIGPASAGQ